MNLLVNAIHALPEQGARIRIETRDWDDKGIVLGIADNGSGIEEDRVGLLFNPFYTSKPQGAGTGLGLSVSYGLIRRYGGNITVRSAPGQGSEFRIWLPTDPVLTEDEETIAEQLRAIESETAGPNGVAGQRQT